MTVLTKTKFADTFPPQPLDNSHPQKVSELSASFPQRTFSESKTSFIDINGNLVDEFQVTPEELQVLEPYLLGTKTSPHSFSYNYGGHQFGHWADQLGDGRAIVIGQLENSEHEAYELQLKGAGPTPFSRRGDGYAVLRSSVREYLASEAIHQLGIPTTRALSIAFTGEKVLRDKFYDGNQEWEKGAIVCRTARSFIRIGNFELLASREQTQEIKDLLHFVCEQHYPELSPKTKNSSELALLFLRALSDRTAKLFSLWQGVGFTHGVLNTDNMSIVGDTIDYGPYGFLDKFDLNYTPNTSDLPGRRYTYGRQIQIAAWNLSCLASALLGIADEDSLVSVLKDFESTYNRHWQERLQEKFGLKEINDNAAPLIQSFFDKVSKNSMDSNFVFRELSESLRDENRAQFLDSLKTKNKEELDFWQSFYDKLKKEQSSPAGEAMCQINPRFILKNHYLQKAIDGLNNDDDRDFQTAKKLSLNPYEDWPEQSDWYAETPSWAQDRSVQMNSCSS